MQASTARPRWFRTGGGEVVKSAAAFVLMLSLAIFIYTAYRSYALRGRNEGDVVGEAPDPNVPGAAHRGASPADHTAATPPTSGTTPAVPSLPGDLGSAAGLPGQIPASAITAPGSSALSNPSVAATSNPGLPPATDTIAPNPPNGLAFGGTGHFQVYRQGDITWRLNTQTGATCVLFASDAEWRQSRIRRNACRDAR